MTRYTIFACLFPIDEGATFVSRDGRVLSAPVLPREALASAESEHERQLEAITISHEFMDPDIRAAMFDVSYDGGELDDDFMQQVMAPAEDGSEGEGFDFDAHVAKLIERSQRVMGLVEEGEEEDVEDYGSEDDDDEEEKGSAVGAAEMAQLDRDFDKALLEYDSDECGALEDPEDDPTLQVLTGAMPPPPPPPPLLRAASAYFGCFMFCRVLLGPRGCGQQ